MFAAGRAFATATQGALPSPVVTTHPVATANTHPGDVHDVVALPMKRRSRSRSHEKTQSHIRHRKDRRGHRDTSEDEALRNNRHGHRHRHRRAHDADAGSHAPSGQVEGPARVSSSYDQATPSYFEIARRGEPLGRAYAYDVPNYGTHDARVPLAYTLGARRILGNRGLSSLIRSSVADGVGSGIVVPTLTLAQAQAARTRGGVWGQVVAESVATSALTVASVAAEHTFDHPSRHRYFSSDAVAADALAEARGRTCVGTSTGPPLRPTATAPISRIEAIRRAIVAGYAREGRESEVVLIAGGDDADDSHKRVADIIPLDISDGEDPLVRSAAVTSVQLLGDTGGNFDVDRSIGESPEAYAARRLQQISKLVYSYSRDARTWRALANVVGLEAAAGAVAADRVWDPVCNGQIPGLASSLKQGTDVTSAADAGDAASAGLRRRLAVLDAALVTMCQTMFARNDQAVPLRDASPSIELSRERMMVFSQLHEESPTTVESEWRKLLLADHVTASTAPSTAILPDPRLWMQYLEWYRSCSRLFSMDGMRARAAEGLAAVRRARDAVVSALAHLGIFVRDSLGTIAVIADSTAPALAPMLDAADSTAIDIIAFWASTENAAGYGHRAIALWQASFEFACPGGNGHPTPWMPGAPLDVRRSLFAAYWMSVDNAPRVGDADLVLRLQEAMQDASSNSGSSASTKSCHTARTEDDCGFVTPQKAMQIYLGTVVNVGWSAWLRRLTANMNEGQCNSSWLCDDSSLANRVTAPSHTATGRVSRFFNSLAAAGHARAGADTQDSSPQSRALCHLAAALAIGEQCNQDHVIRSRSHVVSAHSSSSTMDTAGTVGVFDDPGWGALATCEMRPASINKTLGVRLAALQRSGTHSTSEESSRRTVGVATVNQMAARRGADPIELDSRFLDSDDDTSDSSGRIAPNRSAAAKSTAEQNSGATASHAAVAADEGVRSHGPITFYSPLHGYRVTAQAGTMLQRVTEDASKSDGASRIELVDDTDDTRRVYERVMRDAVAAGKHGDRVAVRSGSGKPLGIDAATGVESTVNIVYEALLPAHPLTNWCATAIARDAAHALPRRLRETDAISYEKHEDNVAPQNGWIQITQPDAAIDGESDDDGEVHFMASALALQSAVAAVALDPSPFRCSAQDVIPSVADLSTGAQVQLALRMLAFCGISVEYATCSSTASAAAVGICSATAMCGPAALGHAVSAVNNMWRRDWCTPDGMTGDIIVDLSTRDAYARVPFTRRLLHRCIAAFPGISLFRSALVALEAETMIRDCAIVRDNLSVIASSTTAAVAYVVDRVARFRAIVAHVVTATSSEDNLTGVEPAILHVLAGDARAVRSVAVHAAVASQAIPSTCQFVRSVDDWRSCALAAHAATYALSHVMRDDGGDEHPLPSPPDVIRSILDAGRRVCATAKSAACQKDMVALSLEVAWRGIVATSVDGVSGAMALEHPACVLIELVEVLTDERLLPTVPAADVTRWQEALGRASGTLRAMLSATSAAASSQIEDSASAWRKRVADQVSGHADTSVLLSLYRTATPGPSTARSLSHTERLAQLPLFDLREAEPIGALLHRTAEGEASPPAGASRISSFARAFAAAALLEYLHNRLKGADYTAAAATAALATFARGTRVFGALCRVLVAARLRVTGAFRHTGTHLTTDAESVVPTGNEPDSVDSEDAASDAEILAFVRSACAAPSTKVDDWGVDVKQATRLRILGLVTSEHINAVAQSSDARNPYRVPTVDSHGAVSSRGQSRVAAALRTAAMAPPARTALDPTADVDGGCGCIDGRTTPYGRALDYILTSLEWLVTTRVRFVALHAATCGQPTACPPALYRDEAAGALALFPASKYLAYAVLRDRHSGGWAERIRGRLAARALSRSLGISAPLALHTSVWEEAVGAALASSLTSGGIGADNRRDTDATATEMTRDVDAAIDSVRRAAAAVIAARNALSRTPRFWRTLLRLELLAGNPAGAITAWRHGVRAAPWCRALWLDRLVRLRPYVLAPYRNRTIVTTQPGNSGSTAGGPSVCTSDVAAELEVMSALRGAVSVGLAIELA